VFAPDSVTDIGFSDNSERTLTVPRTEQLTSLSLELIHLTLAGCKDDVLTELSNVDGMLVNSKEVNITITKRLVLSFGTIADLNEFNFTGDSIMIKSGGLTAEQDITNIIFISTNRSTGWAVTAPTPPAPIFIPAVSNFSVESGSNNVTFFLVADDGRFVRSLLCRSRTQVQCYGSTLPISRRR
jgi:copper chaperone CopZ